MALGWCNKCGNGIESYEFVSHCSAKKIAAHKNGYDLCDKCSSTQAQKSRPEYDDSLVSQLTAFGYNKPQILAAMRAVNNPNDINEIVDWLETRVQNSGIEQPKSQHNDDESKEEEMDFMKFFGSLISLKMVEEYGFGLASDENRIKLLLALKCVDCCRGTALRDAVLAGIVMLLKLKAALVKLDSIKHKFSK